MTIRGIFTLAFLSLTGGLVGCADPILGDWQLASLGPAWDDFERETGIGIGDGAISVDEEYEADFELELLYQGDRFSMDLAGEAEPRDEGRYDLALEDDDGDDVDIECTLESDRLICLFEGDDDDWEMVFERE